MDPRPAPRRDGRSTGDLRLGNHLNLEALRRYAISSSLSQPLQLAATMERMGFVQADPIRSPARAQDLILRHRVLGYRAGDLEQRYPSLDLDEDQVYAYGFVSDTVRRLLHPRGEGKLDLLARDVLEFVRASGPTHPRQLLAQFGGDAETNAWGGQSRSTTRALERLHYRGMLRVARRERGVRVYEAAHQLPPPLSPDERVHGLVLLVVNILTPLPEASVRGVLQHLRRAAPELELRGSVVGDLIRSGRLESGEIDGVTYVWPAGGGPSIKSEEASPTVRFLAPFDPIVWDRRRLEHLWGWAYRFEAYVPAARRQFGYYALPVLWRDDLVGWANLTVKNGRLSTELGFVRGRPRERAFARELRHEITRMANFLGCEP